MKKIKQLCLFILIALSTPLSYANQQEEINPTLTFESPEHRSIGDNILIRCHVLNDMLLLSRNCPLTLSNGLKLTMGDILALAGDFYGIPEESIVPINAFDNNSNKKAYDFLRSTPVNKGDKLRFNSAFATLNGKEKSIQYTKKIDQILKKNHVYPTTEVPQLLAIIKAQTIQLKNAKMACMGNTDCLNNYATKVFNENNKDTDFMVITGGINVYFGFLNKIINGIFDGGRYLKLALNNTDHFGSYALRAYIIGHTIAIEKAQEAGDAYYQGYIKRSQKLLHRAYAKEVFALHFLTDIFAAGHMRTPRQAFGALNDKGQLSTNIPSRAYAALAKYMHDEDGKYGLWVHNANGDVWQSFGDGYYDTSKDEENKRLITQAVQLSVSEITYSFDSPATETFKFSALGLTPDLTALDYSKPTENFMPLFYVNPDNKQLLRRKSLSNRYCLDDNCGHTGAWFVLPTLIKLAI